jgi:hypothetical protein
LISKVLPQPFGKLMKTLLLTGGSSGIGLHTVQLFAEKGWTVFELSRSGKRRTKWYEPPLYGVQSIPHSRMQKSQTYLYWWKHLQAILPAK